jgi:DNA-3-methyladenine glycosylase
VRRGDSPVAELPRDWFGRPTASAVIAQIVETEAYLGTDDPASHAFRGPTPRSTVMFGPAAHLYVYFTYGMHHCANVVTEVDGVAGAVLLRAAAVVEGEATVIARRRDGLPHAALLRGPGNLCQGLGISRVDDGIDLLDPAARVHIAQRTVTPPIAVSTRIGLRLAKDWPLRFSRLGHPAVSRPAPRNADSTR